MGRHRARSGARRGVTQWPFAVVAAAALIVLGWLGWNWAESAMERRAAAQADRCPRGESILRVAVAPSVAQPIADAAARWNDRRTVVADHCVRVQTVAADSEQVFTGLTTGWYEGPLGPQPQAWLPESTFWSGLLALATNDARIGAAPRPVASSPVVLAAPEQAARAITAGSLTWTDLPALTSAPDGWSRFGRPEWGRFTVAMPAPATNMASCLALGGALAGAGPADPATSPLTQLARSQPPDLPGTTPDAMVRLANADRLPAPYGAVAALEVELHRRNLGMDGQPAARQPLVGATMDGPSPVADFPFVALAGEGVDATQLTAAHRFGDFLAESETQRELGRAGLRAATGTEPVDAGTAEQLAAAWSAAADEHGQAMTVLVDVSSSMADDGGNGRSRIDWVREALHDYTDHTGPGSLGLWAFSEALDGNLPYRRLAAIGPIGEQRPALHAGIDALRPAGGTWLYDSVAEVYRAAMDGYQGGRPNQIMIITDGRDDGALTLEQLRERLAALGDRQRPLPINVIAVGHDPDLTELKELASVTGGSVAVLADARGMAAAFARLSVTRR